MESWASVLSSPTIRLSTPSSEAQFFVHRSLLQQQTALLSNLKPRDSHLSLPSPATEATLRIFLEYLYSSSYTLPTPAPTHTKKRRDIAPEEDDTPHPITTTFNASPLLTAASLGALGVWGKAPAKHARYTSIHTGEGVLNNRGTHYPKDSIYVKSDGATYIHPSDASILTPPPSPKLEKKLEIDVPPAPRGYATKQKPLINDHILAQHLEVYRFAKHFNISGLAHLALKNFSEALLAREKAINTADIAKLIETVFTGKHEDKELKAFLVRYAAFRLDKLREDEGFSSFVGKGGEFVLSLLGVVAGKKGVEPWIL
ncbi:hypothetical protein BJ508DRAFT_411963 [Ascobolus immersus RN42]|uniref:BTB domain-containing protein n=1 Tax=Ascobolus immersus RN42 TaxID=1160509 RepID=A0A3N4ILI9_ASCIM|nr:hypothetical protein BJ508DRAFT_411963 [Ascobolus immersus RN42]